jgi:mannose-6-phosphate isomerase
MSSSAPLLLAPNYVPQSYPGGGAGARFRGLDRSVATSPEDWIGSVTERFGQSGVGVSMLPDGRSLRDAVEKSPDDFLGPEHVAVFGDDLGILVKLLDSSERLVVHAHPNRDFARAHLGCAHGKTEAWMVLEARQGAEVYAAFTRDVGREELRAWVDEQRVSDMLESLHAISVSAGSSVLVPAGLPHAIGDGVLVLELQEPTDFSVMLEQGQFVNGDLGLGWDLALDCVDREGWSRQRLAGLVSEDGSRPGRLLPVEADPFFRAALIRGNEDEVLEEGLAILVVTAGEGKLEGDFSGASLSIAKGDTILLPYAAGPVKCLGDVTVIACRPPGPGASNPARPLL